MNVLEDILTYAWRGTGRWVLVTCVVLSVINKIVAFAGPVGLVASLLLGGYFAAIYYQLIQSTAVGGREAPEFPDVANVWDDVMLPYFQIIAVTLVSFGPFFVHFILADGEGGALSLALGCLGIGYFPMAMLAVVTLGYTGALSPHIVLPAIVRAGWLYWFAVGMLVLLYLGESMINDALKENWITGFLIMSVVGVYTMMTNARMLGVIYRERSDHMRWT